MRKILPTGVAALLMAISAHATENPDMCAVVLKTPDGFLALRTKPEPKSLSENIRRDYKVFGA
jgi:hypothetical protein